MNLAIGFDLGTTHLKWIAIDQLSGHRVWDGHVKAGTVTQGIFSEQDPKIIGNHVERILGEASQYGRVSRMSFSAAMHSLLVVDSDGNPVTSCLTWMDKRSQATAKALKLDGLGTTLRRDTGVPIHTMSPLVKWLHLRPSHQDHRPVALKDYIIFRLTGQWVTDYSIAASSGFLGVDGEWLPQALDLGGLKSETMPTLRDMAWGLPARQYDAEVILGGSDGACAHLNLQIPQDGSVAVLAMGTSGALRTTLPGSSDNPGLFSYYMGPNRGYLVGSAFSNVGNVLAWLAQVFGISIEQVISEGIHAIRSEASLPLALPYWFGERSPWWRDDLSGTWLNIGPEHGRSQLIGSMLLSMTASFWHGLTEVAILASSPLKEIRGGSGLLANRDLAQWMTDALGLPLVLRDPGDASLSGALALACGHHVNPDPVDLHYEPGNRSIQTELEDTWHRIQAAVVQLVD